MRRILAEAGADLNAADPDGITPAISAIINGHYDVAMLLVEKGADVNLADNTGRTPLYAAVDFNTHPGVEPAGTQRGPQSSDQPRCDQGAPRPRRQSQSAD